MNEIKKERNLTVDLVKALAILGVITIHSCMYLGEIGSGNWLSVVFWGSISRSSVPLFFMCSGVLFLNPGREVSVRKLYLHTIPRILVAMVVWAFLYKLKAMTDTGVTGAKLYEAFKEVLLLKHDTHFYFLHIILLFYAAVPVLRVFTKAASRQEMNYALGLWFCVAILYPTLKPYWPIKLLEGIPVQWALNLAWGSLGFTLLGHAMMQGKLRSPLVYLAGLVLGFCIIFFGTWYLSAAAGALKTKLMEGNTAGVCILGWGIFGLCRTAAEKGKVPAWVRKAAVYLSGASFCIFLCHLMILRELGKHSINATMTHGILSVPLTACIVCLLSIVVYEILHRIPVVKRWLL